jgi:hypothetical protein
MPTTTTVARFGYCHVRHRPKMPAQSGYCDDEGNRYCRACFKARFPERYKEKIPGVRSCAWAVNRSVHFVAKSMRKAWPARSVATKTVLMLYTYAARASLQQAIH